MTIAQTIKSQLGDNKFVAMTGAKNFVDIGNGLQFDVAGKKMIISLNHDDTYRVQYGKLNRKTFVFEYMKDVPMVYADCLKAVFTMVTGLDTHL